MRYVEDPSIAGAARVEHARMLEELQRRYANGEGYFQVREEIIHRDGPWMAKKYGKDTAKRALAALTSYGPADMPADVRHCVREDLLRSWEAAHDYLHGGCHKFTPWQRWLFHTFGFLGVFKTLPKQTGRTLWGHELREHQRLWNEREMAEFSAKAAKERAKREAEEEEARADAANKRAMAATLRRLARAKEKGLI